MNYLIPLKNHWKNWRLKLFFVTKRIRIFLHFQWRLPKILSRPIKFLKWFWNKLKCFKISYFKQKIRWSKRTLILMNYSTYKYNKTFKQKRKCKIFRLLCSSPSKSLKKDLNFFKLLRKCKFSLKKISKENWHNSKWHLCLKYFLAKT